MIELNDEPQEIKSPDAHGNNHVMENSDALQKSSDDEDAIELNSDELNLALEVRQEKLIAFVYFSNSIFYIFNF